MNSSTGKPGAPAGKQGAPVGNRNAMQEKTNPYNISLCLEEKLHGTSRQYALRRLRKDRPDLHEKVLSKDLSAHAAMKDGQLEWFPARKERAKKQSPKKRTTKP